MTLFMPFMSEGVAAKRPQLPHNIEEAYSPKNVREVLDIEQKRAFMHSWKTADANGMIHASSDIKNKKITLGGSGFCVMSILAGADRGWITEEEALDRVLNVTSFLKRADRIHGAWSHWMNPDGTPARFGKQIEAGDIVETSFMVMGLLCASEYFDGKTAKEIRLRKDVQDLWEGIDWNFYTDGGNFLYWGLDRTTGNYFLPIKAYNEALVTYILALAAENGNGIDPQVYSEGWWNTKKGWNPGRTYYGYDFPLGGPYGGPMFLSHYSFLGMNPKDMQDSKVNYYTNGAKHAMIQRHYCMYEAPKEYGYNEFNWGLSAGNGPKGKGYQARMPLRDDGVIAPTAALASMPYTPFYSIQVLMELHYNHPELQTQYGFGDGYSIVDNWVERGIIAIDNEPIVIMIENYRSGLFWNLMKDNEIIRRGLEKTDIRKPSFKTGFPYAVRNTVTDTYDMIRHPDRGVYELDFCLEEASEVEFTLRDKKGREIQFPRQDYAAGVNIFSFDDHRIVRGERYHLEMKDNDNIKATIDITLN